jgi:hypothetical protein
MKETLKQCQVYAIAHSAKSNHQHHQERVRLYGTSVCDQCDAAFEKTLCWTEPEWRIQIPNHL